MGENAEEKKSRSSRFKRLPLEKRPAYQQGPRDVEIIRYVHDFRFLTSAHIIALTGGDKTSIEKRLFVLWQHEFIDRRSDQDQLGLPRGRVVYQLDKKGAELLAASSGSDPDVLKWSVERNQVGQPYLRHALMVAHIRTVFELATRARSDVELLFWRNDKDTNDRISVKDEPLFRGYGKESVAIVPDSFFGLGLMGGKGYFMVEADRSTMDFGDFLRKLRAYFLWWRANGHTAKFDIKRFVVLTVCDTKGRAQKLFELSQKADDLKKGCGLFWFTDIDSFFLEHAESILNAPIWMTWDRGAPVTIPLLKQ